MEPTAMMNPRKRQGEILKASLMELRRIPKSDEPWPWKHPFDAVHSSALHEAGHVVLAVAFGRRLSEITIIRDEIGDGSVGREIRESGPHDAVEEILIKYAGYEAARLYGFETDDSCDATDVEQIKERWPILDAINESEARTSVRQALIRCRFAVEDLATALFTRATIEGEAAFHLIAAGIPESARIHLAQGAERLLRDSASVVASLQRGKQLLQKINPGVKPVFLLGWGRDGVKDVEYVREYLGPDDQSIAYTMKPNADSREVLDALEAWFRNNSFAMLLYIGAHGIAKVPAGLVPKATRNRDRISYEEIAQSIQTNLNQCAEPLCVCIGACESTEAVPAFESSPVHLLIAFPGEPTSYQLRRLIIRVLAHRSLRSQDNQSEDRPISDLVEDIEELRQEFQGASIYHKTSLSSRLLRVDDEDGIRALREQLASCP